MKEERAQCARQFGVIDLNHYRQHRSGWQKASHRFIFGHLFRQKLGWTHSELGLNISVCVCVRETRKVCKREGLRDRLKAEASVRGHEHTGNHMHVHTSTDQSNKRQYDN